MYRFLAHALVIFHVCFIAFAVGGACLLAWRKWVAFIHIPAALWGIIVERWKLQCPLTHWENRLRAAAGDAAYQGGFIEHYILPVLYPDDITPDLQMTVARVILTVNIVFYVFIFTRPGRRRRQPNLARALIAN